MIEILILNLLNCMTATQFNAESCMPIINEIVEEQTITHKWYSEDSIVQDYVQYAYDLWGLDFVKLIECENWQRNPYRWSNTKDYGLCQVNIPTHKVPEWFYDDPYIQLDYCYYLYSNHTPFYGPNRKIKGMKCSDYVNDRFLLN